MDCHKRSYENRLAVWQFLRSQSTGMSITHISIESGIRRQAVAASLTALRDVAGRQKGFCQRTYRNCWLWSLYSKRKPKVIKNGVRKGSMPGNKK